MKIICVEEEEKRKTTKIFFSTQMTKLSKNGKLISLGLMTSDGHGLYVENRDVIEDEDEIRNCDEFVIRNVLPTLFKGKEIKIKIKYKDESTCDADLSFMRIAYHYGGYKDIREKVLEFLSKFEHVVFYGDCCHYTTVFLFDLLTSDEDGNIVGYLPSNCSFMPHDINNDLAQALSISEEDAFSIDRLKLSPFNYPTPGSEDFLYKKHNSIIIAMIMSTLYKGIIKKMIKNKRININ